MGSQDSVVVDSDSCDGENVETTKKVRWNKTTGDSATDTCTNEHRDMKQKKGTLWDTQADMVDKMTSVPV